MSRQAASTDPLTGSAWSQPGTVSGFVRSAPNLSLIEYAKGHLIDRQSARLLDVGCGYGQTPSFWPSSDGTSSAQTSPGRCCRLPGGPGRAIATRACPDGPASDPRSQRRFRRRPRYLEPCEKRRRVPARHRRAARVSRPGGALFVFTFSRSTLPPAAQPVEGERFVYTHFSGHPQCFVTAEQLLEELHGAGFSPDARLPLRELNRPPALDFRMKGVPVIYQGGFRYR